MEQQKPANKSIPAKEFKLFGIDMKTVNAVLANSYPDVLAAVHKLQKNHID